MGNPTSYLGKTLTWEGKQLTQLSMTIAGANVSLNYDYDENGLRMQKQYSVFGATNTMSYYYNGSVLIGMETEQGAIMRFSYDAGGNVGSVDYSDDYGDTFTTYYYLRNAQGDIVKLIDGSGNTVVEYTYDSWGRIIATTGSLANTVGADQPFRYRGYVYDEETGFYYLQSRYYDPTTCRFISADVLLSTGQGVLGHNSFAYCGNNPVVRIDSNGKFWLTVIIVTAVVLTVGLTATGCSNLVPVYMDTAYPELLLGSKELNTDTADLSEYNCMGYAFGIESNCEPVGWFDGMSSDGLCDCLEATFGDGIRKLTSINDKLVLCKL